LISILSFGGHLARVHVLLSYQNFQGGEVGMAQTLWADGFIRRLNKKKLKLN
jgi:hypothetical protein